MENGDFFVHPKEDPFKVPEYYNDLDEDIRNDLFWVKMMQADQPFEFAKGKMFRSKPICWTNKPGNLSRKLKIPVKTIEETQKSLLYQSLLNSNPVRLSFLPEYEAELTETAQFIKDLARVSF